MIASLGSKCLFAVSAVAALLVPSTQLAAAPVGYQVYFSPARADSLVLEDAHYQHAATVAQLGSRVYVAWNGNNFNSVEGKQGQVIMLRTSDDGGVTWSPHVTIPFVKAYRALDETTGKIVDAPPGDADDDHKVINSSAIESQPSLTVFNGSLCMFWGMNRNVPGSALMMSMLESDGSQQWRSYELHFGPYGVPSMLEESNGATKPTSDPTYLTLGAGASYTSILGADTLPRSLLIQDMVPALLATEPNGVAGSPPPDGVPVDLTGARLVPSSNQASVLTLSNGTQVLAVSVILEQTGVDWDNLAVKIPAVLTTTDLQNWQLSVVPLKSGSADFLGSSRGDVGLVSAWEPSTNVDYLGNFHMQFRVNVPPVKVAPPPAASAPAASDGFRAGGAIGTFRTGQGIQWQTAHRDDYDLAVSRASIAKIDSTRWVMAGNNDVQGASYDGVDPAPAFKADKFDPWARENLTLFFSMRGDDDFVSGFDMSLNLGIAGVQEIHYPQLQSAAIGGTGNDLLVAFSTHRRTGSCSTEAECNDAIHFTRIKAFPDPQRPAIYPNHFATVFAFGQSTPQPKTYGYTGNVLTLFGRGSAGIETQGHTGCIDVRFKINSGLAVGDRRPVLSFGRSTDRSVATGLAVVGASGGARLMLANTAIGSPVVTGQWTDARVCYDFSQGLLTAGGASASFGPGGLSQRSYLGDPTLAFRSTAMPDLAFDLTGTSLDAGATQ